MHGLEPIAEYKILEISMTLLIITADAIYQTM